jgi:hypothetical protein
MAEGARSRAAEPLFALAPKRLRLCLQATIRDGVGKRTKPTKKPRSEQRG